jgi:hypothetical protein
MVSHRKILSFSPASNYCATDRQRKNHRDDDYRDDPHNSSVLLPKENRLLTTEARDCWFAWRHWSRRRNSQRDRDENGQNGLIGWREWSDGSPGD